MEKSNVSISPPWCEYAEKLKALFKGDPRVSVGEIGDTQTPGHKALSIEVLTHKKFVALEKILPKKVTFGNISLEILLFDKENTTPEDNIYALYKDAFAGNYAVEKVIETTDATGLPHLYICFKPEVVQFYNDNMGDYYGNWNGLAQDIAREVFDKAPLGVHFCTAEMRTNEDVDF